MKYYSTKSIKNEVKELGLNDTEVDFLVKAVLYEFIISKDKN